MSVLYGAIGGAIAGALGGAIGYGLTTVIWADREPSERPKWLSGVCVALMVVASRPIVQWWETPSINDELVKAERAYPALAALRETDPSAYSAVRVAAQQAQEGTITEAEGMQRVHTALMATFKRKLPRAPDNLIQAEAQLAGAEYSALQGTPDICVNDISGAGVVDLRNYLPPNMLASDQNVIVRVLRSPQIGSPSVASQAEVQRTAAPILSKIAHDEGVSMGQVGEALQMKGDQRLTCRVYADLFQQISELPTHQAASITRGLVRMSESPES